MQRQIQPDNRLKNVLNASYIKIGDAMDPIRSGANSNIKSDYGYSFLHLLVGIFYKKSIDNNQDRKYIMQKIEELVLRHHADIHILDANKETPLQVLLSNSVYPADLLSLVKLGANSNTRTRDGRSLLHRILESPEYIATLPIIKELITKYNASIYITNSAGRTPLEYLLEKVDKKTLLHLSSSSDPNHKALQEIISLLEGKDLKKENVEEKKVIPSSVNAPKPSAPAEPASRPNMSSPQERKAPPPYMAPANNAGMSGRSSPTLFPAPQSSSSSGSAAGLELQVMPVSAVKISSVTLN